MMCVDGEHVRSRPREGSLSSTATPLSRLYVSFIPTHTTLAGRCQRPPRPSQRSQRRCTQSWHRRPRCRRGRYGGSCYQAQHARSSRGGCGAYCGSFRSGGSRGGGSLGDGFLGSDCGSHKSATWRRRSTCAAQGRRCACACAVHGRPCACACAVHGRPCACACAAHGRPCASACGRPCACAGTCSSHPPCACTCTCTCTCACACACACTCACTCTCACACACACTCPHRRTWPCGCPPPCACTCACCCPPRRACTCACGARASGGRGCGQSPAAQSDGPFLPLCAHAVHGGG